MKFFIQILFLTLLISSCDKFDKAEQRPAFLKIEAINLTTNISTQGSNSNKIVDAWVYIDDVLIGTYNLPNTIPITNIGNHEIKIVAGIKKNGISVDRKKYPFYKPYIFTQNLEADSTYSIYPTVTYEENISLWFEDFEDPSYKLNPHQSDTTIQIVSSPANDLFEGDAGVIFLDGQYKCEMRTSESSFNNMPTNLSTPAYMELDYKSNFPLEIGILANQVAGETYTHSALITLSATNGQWNKTYLYLPDASNFYANSPEFDVYFRVTNPNQVNGIKIYIDNIKVVFWN